MFRKLKKLFYRGFKRDKFQIANRKGGVFLLNYKNYIDRKILVDGLYEPEQVAKFAELATNMQAAYFFDIGANIGVYTVQMARIPTIHTIVSFEPMPANRSQLHANLLLNGLSELVEVHPYALSNTDGNAVFLQNKGNSTGRSRIKETNTYTLDDTKFEEVIVQTKKLDGISEIKNQKLAFKIDVEGHELMVLEGMPLILQNNICLLQIESYQESAAITDEFLQKLGYSLITTINADRYYSNSPEMPLLLEGCNV